MFTVNSSSFNLSADDVYNCVDSYLNFSENSNVALATDGILVSTTAPSSHWDRFASHVVVHFAKDVYKSMYNDMVAELHSMEDAIDQEYDAMRYAEAVECIQIAVQNSDMARAESGNGMPARYPGLWELAESRALTIEQLDEIIAANGWN